MGTMIGKRTGSLRVGKMIVSVAIVLPALLCIEGCSAVVVPTGDIAQRIDESRDQRAAELRNLAKAGHAEFLEHCLRNYRERYKDYLCTLVKQERIGGTVRAEQEVAVKFKESSFSVAMAWVRGADLGDRVLYVEGKHGNQMLVRPVPLLRPLVGQTVRRDPNGEEARKHSLRTVDQFGFERSMTALLDVYRLAERSGDLKEELGPDANVLGRKALVLIRLLPQKKEYPAWKTVTYIDQEWLVPILVEAHGWGEEEFLCRYLYRDVRFNVGLTDDDFLPEKNDLQPPKP